MSVGLICYLVMVGLTIGVVLSVIDKSGKMAILILWAPIGADNADQWKLISESFRW